MAALFRLQTYEVLASTNEVVKAALHEGEPEGLVVQAFSQTGGYGRQGRVWASPRGGLYLSVLLRPQVPTEQLPTLSLVAGLAARRAAISLIDSRFSENVLMKWPNDLVVADSPQPLSSQSSAPDSPSAPCSCGTRASRSDSPRSRKELSANLLRESSSSACGAPVFSKLCGISLEAVAGGVCVGIGMNVVPSDERIVVEGKNTPAYLAQLGHASDVAVSDGTTLARSGCESFAETSIVAVRDAVLNELETLYKAWLAMGLESFAEELHACDALAGRAISIVDQRGEVVAQGIARGIDERGYLLLETQRGLVPISSGEAHVR